MIYLFNLKKNINILADFLLKLKPIRFNQFFKNNFGALILIVTISSPSIAFQGAKTSLVKDSPKEVIDEVWQIIYRDYLDSSGDYNPKSWIDLRKKLLSNKYAHYDNAYIQIREMLSSLNDPYTRFLDPKEFNEMKIDTSGQLMGVGIQISIDNDTGKIVVVSPIEGTPASKAGIQPKDVIYSINGEITKGMGIDDAVRLIRGERGTSVILGIIRGEELIRLSLERDRIEINSVSSRLNLTNSGESIGYIRLKQFNANAAKEMAIAINTLEEKNAKGYLLDLRGNPGGLLESSIDISRQWIDRGIIVSTKTKDGINDVRKATGRALTQKPLVLLVNEGSASASEILSGAVRDNKRGLIVGKKTFGKGLVQSVRSLSDGSGLLVTVAKYLTPKGIDINKNGIKPDIEVDISKNALLKFSRLDIATINDRQYMVAQTELARLIARQRDNSNYIPTKTNFGYALSK